ncbi:MAG: hypothetical protein J6U00_06900 [Ruminococcus sp.]|uniref:hypothetical protein n=1 Tax=Ruminococcus sp. TaxID=41978 RepID=UPI001B09EEC7|nr:hypothetical protein [Ruminococcus sp.]MBO7473716.1 hypothetical protein [Ruminococcus sp.]
MKKTRELLIAAILIFSAVVCIFASGTIGVSVNAALQRCLTAVIPSLFAMIAVSSLLIRSGSITYAGRFFHKAGRFLFGMDGDIFLIFLFSNIAGYPVGARMLLTYYEAGRITKRETELLEGVCFGAGPSFIYGCIAFQLYHSQNIGLLISISSAAASITAALILSFFLRKQKPNTPEQSTITFHSAMLPECISSAGRSIAEICAAILGFAVLSATLAYTGILPAAADLLSKLNGTDYLVSAGIICSFLDVTAIGSLPENDFTLLPVISALVTFGGGCVFMQLTAIFRGKLSLIPAIVIRVGTSIISYIICKILLPFFISGEIVSASLTPHIHSKPSPVPSVILAIMTAMIFVQYEKSRKA